MEETMPGVEVLDQLLSVSGATQAFLRTEYTLYRQARDGFGNMVLTLQILDAGPSKPESRYTVQVNAEDIDRAAFGQPAASVEGAIASVYWGTLDQG